MDLVFSAVVTILISLILIPTIVLGIVILKPKIEITPNVDTRSLTLTAASNAFNLLVKVGIGNNNTHLDEDSGED